MRDKNQSNEFRRDQLADGKNPYGYRSARGDRKRKLRAWANSAINNNTTCDKTPIPE